MWVTDRAGGDGKLDYRHLMMDGTCQYHTTGMIFAGLINGCRGNNLTVTVNGIGDIIFDSDELKNAGARMIITVVEETPTHMVVKNAIKIKRFLPDTPYKIISASSTIKCEDGVMTEVVKISAMAEGDNPDAPLGRTTYYGIIEIEMTANTMGQIIPIKGIRCQFPPAIYLENESIKGIWFTSGDDVTGKYAAIEPQVTETIENADEYPREDEPEDEPEGDN